jgi:cytochrome c
MRLLVALVIACFAVLAAAQDRTIWDGVYTTGQAERGKAAYALHCQLCHGDELNGGSDGCDPAPALRRAGFAENRKDLNNLYDYVKSYMPRDEPGSLEGRTVIDVIAFLLQQNSIPPGTEELPVDPAVLKRITTVR